jgi:hypothetical protein
MKRAADLATVVGALVAVGVFLFGFHQFAETQEMARRTLELQMETLKNDRELKAMELFLKFNEQEQELATKPPPRKGEAGYWRSNALLGTTEAVFRLTRGDKAWETTVSWMLEVQRPFLIQTEFDCSTFAADFVILMKKAAPDLKCKASPNQQ